MRFAARSVPLNWKNKIEYGRKNLRKWKIKVADTVILYYTKLKLFPKSGRKKKRSSRSAANRIFGYHSGASESRKENLSEAAVRDDPRSRSYINGDGPAGRQTSWPGHTFSSPAFSKSSGLFRSRRARASRNFFRPSRRSSS